MKKILVIITIVISALTLNAKAANIDLPEKTNREPVKVHLFYADWCGNCHNFMSYFLENYKDEYKDYFEIVAYESSSVAGNNALAMQLKDHFEIEKFGWPFIVVGDDYYLGYGSTTGEDVTKAALEAYADAEYKDVVAETAKGSDGIEAETLKEAAIHSGIEVKDDDTSEKSSIPDSVFVAIIFIVVLGGIGGLAFLARK